MAGLGGEAITGDAKSPMSSSVGDSAELAEVVVVWMAAGVANSLMASGSVSAMRQPGGTAGSVD